MFSSVNIRSSIPVYQQIENLVLFGIASGKLQAGDKLPPVKTLADRVGVNFNTVAKAYRDLEVLGLITTRRGMGCFVKKGVQGRIRATCSNRLVERIFEVTQEAKASGLSKKELSNIIDESLAVDNGPYSETPSSLKAALKRKK